MYEIKWRMVAGGTSWEVWSELRHLKYLGIFWKIPATGPVLFLRWVSRLFWLHLFSMCWARSTKGLLENPRQGVSSRHWQLPSSTGVQFPTGAKPSLTTKLKAKPWINWLPYIVNISEKGSSSKGKMSKTDYFPWNWIPGGDCPLRCPQESCAAPRSKRVWVGHGQEASKLLHNRNLGTA